MVPGALIADRFTVVRTIARSPMSLVVEATDERGEHVVVKLLETDGSASHDARLRFEREGRLVTALKSPHVVRVFEVGTTAEGRPFLVMELLTGNTLARELKKRKRIPVEEASAYIAETCDALIEAHDAGIVHRDIKPQNLFLIMNGEQRMLKVLDFGISKMMNPGDAITATDALFGSPLYMAPETFRAAKLADARSDVWSLGVVLYEMVTGVSPFAADTPVGVGLKVTREPFVPASWKCPDLPAKLDSVIGRALAKSPNERFQTVRALVRALGPFLPAGHDTLLTRAAFENFHSADDNPRTMAETEIATRIVAPGDAALVEDRPSLDALPTRIVPTGDSYDVTTKIRATASPVVEAAPLPPAPPTTAAGMTTVMPMVTSPPAFSALSAAAEPAPEGSETGPIASPLSVTAKPLERPRPRSRLVVAALVAAPIFGVVGYLAGHRSDSQPHAAAAATLTATAARPPTDAPRAALATDSPSVAQTAPPAPTSAAASAAASADPASAPIASASAHAPPHVSRPPQGGGSHHYNPAAP